MRHIQLKLPELLKIPIKVSPKRRSIALKMTRLGEIELLAPPYVSDDFLMKFVDSRRSWIKKRIVESSHSKLTLPVDFFNNWQESSHLTEQVAILINGKNHSMRLGEIRSGLPQFHLNDSQLILDYNGKSTPSALLNHFKKWMKSEAERDFDIRLNSWASKMGLNFHQLEIKSFKSRWGDCNTKRTIRMNWKAFACPDWVRDSLCIHELAHLVEMNHSAKFYEIVRTYDVRERESHHWLKEHALILEY